MADNMVTLTRGSVRRPWQDVEPKIVIAGAAGFLAIVALIVAKAFHVSLPNEVQAVIPLAFAVLAGYLTPSVGTTIIHPNEFNNTIVEQHTGQVVSTVTGPVAVQSAPKSFTDIVEPPKTTAWGLSPRDPLATEVMPSDMSAD